LVSAALFALVHNRGFNYTLVLFLTGVVLGAVYLRSACLPRLVVAHWLHNLLVMAQYV
jgi:membrane protease YdiL (CAAX protease family)